MRPRPGRNDRGALVVPETAASASWQKRNSWVAAGESDLAVTHPLAEVMVPIRENPSKGMLARSRLMVKPAYCFLVQ